MKEAASNPSEPESDGSQCVSKIGRPSKSYTRASVPGCKPSLLLLCDVGRKKTMHRGSFEKDGNPRPFQRRVFAAEIRSRERPQPGDKGRWGLGKTLGALGG